MLLLSSASLASLDDDGPEPPTKPSVDNPSWGDVNDGRVFPFLNVGLPELGSLPREATV
jgi:hypothetical protein